MKKNYIVIQNGLKDCGCACLLSVIRYYGGNVPMDKLLELTNTTSSGTNFYDITKAANEIGLSSKGYKLNSINKLDETEKPFISQVIINNYKHFVVVYKIKNNIITIMDPAKGMVKLTIDGFNKIWTSYILILTPYKKLPFLEDNNYLNSVIKKVIRNNKTIIMCLLLMTLTVTILTTIYGFYFKIIVDNYQKQSRLTILNITIIFTFILTIKVITEYLRNYLLIILNKRIDLTLITTAIKKIIHLPYNYYKNKTTGEVIARINDSTSEVKAYLDKNNHLVLKATTAQSVDNPDFVIRHVEDSGYFLAGYSGVLAGTGADGAYDFAQADASNALRGEFAVSPVLNPAGYVEVNPDIKGDVLSVAAAYPNSQGKSMIGDARAAVEIASIRNTDVMIGKDRTFDDYFANSVTNVGLKGEQAEMNMLSQNAIMDDLRNLRDSISGVNIDEELAEIIKFQHGYNAAAKFITVWDNLVDTVINRLGV